MANDEAEFCKQLQTAWDIAFAEAEQKAEQQLAKEYMDTVGRVLKKLNDLAGRGDLDEDSAAAAEYLRCTSQSMSRDDFRELRRVLTEQTVGPPAEYLGRVIEKQAHEVAGHGPAKAGLQQLALKYQRRQFGDGISPTVSYKLLGRDQ